MICFTVLNKISPNSDFFSFSSFCGFLLSMATSSFGLTAIPHFPFRRCIHKIRVSSVAPFETLHDSGRALQSICLDSVAAQRREVGDDREVSGIVEVGGDREVPRWKTLNSEDLGITTSMISKPARIVLNGLKKRGYEVYLVGGCVRDLILKQTPKDFDILTSAELNEVVGTFSQCHIVGRRFPICHVHIGDIIVEVSSFSTSAKKGNKKLSHDFGTPIGFNKKDYRRWRNCLRRDFTVNGLMFEPYEQLVYDYLGGMEDIRKAKVRTIIPANTSFQEDCARILRATRIAARLGFRFSKETAQSIKHLSRTILKLDKGRLLMEANYMLAYGSAEASLRLLWKFGLLEILLPIQAAYFVSQGFRRRDKGSNMLLTLFSNLDKLLAPDRPCHDSLWVAILAFHQALLDKPRDPLTVATFTLAVHSGGDMAEAIKIAKRISRQHNTSFNELSEPQNLKLKSLTYEVMDLAESMKESLMKMTDEYYVSQAMVAYPQAPYSDLVLIPLRLYLRVCKIFECVKKGKEGGFVPKEGDKVDYDLLAMGSLKEVRHIFARVVFDTVYPLALKD